MRTGIACARQEVRDRLDGPECCFLTGDGWDAVRLCREKMPDVLILDGVLAGLDGRGVMEKLAEDPPERMPAVVGLGWQDFACGAKLDMRAGRRELADILDGLCDGQGRIWTHRRLAPGCTAKISGALDRLGVPMRLRGRECMARALELLLRDMTLKTNLTGGLFVPVGKAMGMTAGGVERAVRTAVENAWKRTGYAYFAEAVDPEKGMPTVGQFLIGAAEGIRTGRLG